MKRMMVPVALAVCVGAVSIPFLARSGGAQRAPVTSLDSLVVNATPFQDNDGQIPPKPVYEGPMFHLNHDWPAVPPPPVANFPWQQAIHGQQITQQNALAYTEALKTYVTANAKQLIFNYANWNPKAAGWYNEPWLGSKREPIHGAYSAGEFGPSTFPGTGLRANFTTHVLTYYDPRAAYTLSKIWGKTAMKPDIQTANSQFAEGAVIVKAAMFASETASMPTDWWDVLKGAAVLPMYIDATDIADPPTNPVKMSGYLAQFDIIVKDSVSSPKTGWVFTTLVYDPGAPGKDAWDKMVPLGAMWGNDPGVTAPGSALKESWINPAAPKYSTMTLGWGGRLSGPNDGAQNAIAYGGKSYANVADSSCMSCHGPAEWDKTKNQMDSFILPATKLVSLNTPEMCGNNGQPDPKGNYICSPAPASADWMRWFQSRPGTVPQDATAVALDYDDVTAFKSLPLWWAATGPKGQPIPEMLRPSHVPRYNQYTGAPLRPK